MTPPLKGCEIVVSDADFQGKVALQNIEDFEIWGTAQVDANGTYSKAVRRDRYVYITANYSDWQRPIEDVFVSEITNAGLTSPKKNIFL
jgi:intein-encoded DNA endonuclease-like protein